MRCMRCVWCGVVDDSQGASGGGGGGGGVCCFFFFFQAEDGIRDRDG